MKQLIVICGPTGIGKTRIAIELAKHFNSEIVSADSRQIYKEMTIGTAVPSADERKKVKHHFIQIQSVKDYYNASMYEQDVIHFLEEFYQQNEIAFLVGGSGMYIDAVCRGIDDIPTIPNMIRAKWQHIYQDRGLIFLQEKLRTIDPVYYEKVDRNNPNRLLKAIEVQEVSGRPYSSFLSNKAKSRSFSITKLGLDCERNILYEAINRRVEVMVQNGLEQEVRSLIPLRNYTPLKTVGYRELFNHVDGEIELDEAIEQIKNHSRAYARRQLTWFRRYKDLKWFSPDDLSAIIDSIEGTFKNYAI